VNVQDLELRWVADQLEIRNLIARLAQAIDHGTLAEYAECWHEDAEWWPPSSPVHIPTDPKVDREAIIDGAESRREDGHQGPGTHTKHVVSTTSLTATADADVVRAQTYYTAYVDTYDDPKVISVGHWDDEYVRTSSGWRLRSRRATRG
jgi:3-phenylpropionate/cinnamic acid dioxygenase small subunit